MDAIRNNRSMKARLIATAVVFVAMVVPVVWPMGMAESASPKRSISFVGEVAPVVSMASVDSTSPAALQGTLSWTDVGAWGYRVVCYGVEDGARYGVADSGPVELDGHFSAYSTPVSYPVEDATYNGYVVLVELLKKNGSPVSGATFETTLPGN